MYHGNDGYFQALSTWAQKNRITYRIFLYGMAVLQIISLAAILSLQMMFTSDFTRGLRCIVIICVTGFLYSIFFNTPSIHKENGARAVGCCLTSYVAFTMTIFYQDSLLVGFIAAVFGLTELCFWPLAFLLAIKLTEYQSSLSWGKLLHKVISYLFFGGTICMVSGYIFSSILTSNPTDKACLAGLGVTFEVNNSITVDGETGRNTTGDSSVEIPQLMCSDDAQESTPITFLSTVISSVMMRIIFLSVVLSYWDKLMDVHSPTPNRKKPDNLESENLQIKAVSNRRVHRGPSSVVVIEVQGVRFSCNRQVLAKVSGYFKTLFRNTTFMENNTGIIVVTGPHGYELSPQTMRSILGFAYTQYIWITNENVYDISIAADYLQIEDLQALCIKHLKSLITSQTWTSIFRFASWLCLSQLISACMDSFQKVYRQIDFNHYHYSEIKLILEAQQKKMASTGVFETLLCWVNSIKMERKRYFDDLLQYVDFKSMNIRYVSEKVCNEEVILERPDIVTKICRTMANRRLLVIGGLTKKAERSAVKYCPENRVFVPCSSAPNHCHASAFVIYGNKVIVAGGTGNAYDIQLYDADRDTWTMHRSVLSVPRCYAGACVINNKLYLVGGWDIREKERLSSVEVIYINNNGQFIPSAGTNTIPALCNARTDHAIISRKNEIFVIGGFDDSEKYLKSCEAINTMTKERYDISPLNEGRSHLAAVLHDDHIIAIGGKCGVYDKLASMECYSFETNMWTFLSEMKTARWGHCACVHDGKVYVVGGQRTKLIESYDPATATWESHQRIDIPRWGSWVGQIVGSSTTIQ